MVLAGLLRNRKDNEPLLAPGAVISLLVLLGFSGLNLAQIAPYYLPDTPPVPVTNAQQRITLLHCNLFGLINRDPQRFVQLVRTVKPDMFDVVEYNDAWRRKLEHSGILNAYPYRVTARGNMALYSKLPLSHTRITFTDPARQVANQANIIAHFTLNRQPVTILVAHPASPIRPSHLTWLQESFHTWEAERRRLGSNLIIVGDLNTTPWSVEFQDLIHSTGLRDSQLGFGLQTSWPVLLPILGVREHPNWLTSLFRIPIDHVLVSPNIDVLSRQTGPFVGSDPLPVIIQLTANRPTSRRLAESLHSP
jgi:endonuclease/exonuclease/phosphatase (EEP) superfamily protein YafD